MTERLMMVTGAFASHTTKLYNYYICPDSWDVKGLTHIGVNYFKELKYLGRIIEGPYRWSFDESKQSIRYGKSSREIPPEIKNDLEQFKSLLNGGGHYLFLLYPIIGGCIHDNLIFKGKGVFTMSHRYFPSIGDMLAAHQGIKAIPYLGLDEEGKSSSKIDFQQ